MICGRRLPVAPRPYRDELLSSWLGRVACRYGLDAASLVGAIAMNNDARAIPIDDATPPQEDIASWAQACGVDPGRVARLTLARRRPERSKVWFLSQGPPWASTAVRSPPVCRACFEADRSAGRDEHLRADWMLAERCACPAHRQVLLDHCPRCGWQLYCVFRLRDGRARLVCGRCAQELAANPSRAEEDRALIDALVFLQDRIGTRVNGAPEGRARLEAALAKLWAPLDDPGAARPVLALWIDESGWRCPSEVQHVIGAPFPLGRLPIGFRIATLIAADTVFNLGDQPLTASGAAAVLIRRSASGRVFANEKRPARSVISPARHPLIDVTDYKQLAYEILKSPEWRAAVDLPQQRRRRILARLIDAALAVRPAKARRAATVQQ